VRPRPSKFRRAWVRHSPTTGSTMSERQIEHSKSLASASSWGLHRGWASSLARLGAGDGASDGRTASEELQSAAARSDLRLGTAMAEMCLLV
jgi:hypothetical protein